MKTYILVLLTTLLFSSLAMSAEKEIFGKLIIKIDSKKFKYFRPGSFTDNFVIRPDQAVVLAKKVSKSPIVLGHINEIDPKGFQFLCSESLRLLQEMKKKDQVHSLIQKNQDNCQIMTKVSGDITIQWLHKYKFKGAEYVLSLSTTQKESTYKATVSFIEEFLKGNVYELR